MFFFFLCFCGRLVATCGCSLVFLWAIQMAALLRSNSGHIRIISCVSLEPFLLTLNLDAMSSSNVFSSLIYVFRCKGMTVLNK